MDLGRNKLTTLPEAIVNLASLKVLAVTKNRIEDLPPCLADMASLVVLKVDGNPLSLVPEDILERQPLSPLPLGLSETEAVDIVITGQIKKILKQKSLAPRWTLPYQSA